MIYLLLISALVALATCVGMTFWVRSLAPAPRLFGADARRHLQDRRVPRLGGIAVYAAVVTASGVGVLLMDRLPPRLAFDERMAVILIGGGSMVFLVGLWDDLRGLTARIKFWCELAVALAVVAAALAVGGVHARPDALGLAPLFLLLAVSSLWIVGVTNALNLIDGSDGVATGTALVAAAALGAVGALNGDLLAALLALAVVGAGIGFLFFNFPPASIYLGDSGSLFLGYTLAILGLRIAGTGSTLSAAVIPIVALGLPLLDTGLSVVRRFLRRQSVFQPDQGHVHHRLGRLGHSPRQVALHLWSLCFAFGMLAIMLILSSAALMTAVGIAGTALVYLWVKRLEIPELMELQRVVQRGNQHRSAIAHNLRIREASDLLRKGGRPDLVVPALFHAFSQGEFQRVELWLQCEAAVRGLNGSATSRGDPSAPAWRWSGEPPAHATNGHEPWEVSLPLRDEKQRVIGHLSLISTTRAATLLTDLRLIAGELHPALQGALRTGPGVELIPPSQNGVRHEREDEPAGV